MNKTNIYTIISLIIIVILLLIYYISKNKPNNINIINNEIIFNDLDYVVDNKKYINAGVHNSFKVFGKAIFIKYININIKYLKIIFYFL